jgi:hypothetical protein
VNGELSGDRLASPFLQLDVQPSGVVPGSPYGSHAVVGHA